MEPAEEVNFDCHERSPQITQIYTDYKKNKKSVQSV